MRADPGHRSGPRRALRLGEGVLVGAAATVFVLAAMDARAGSAAIEALPPPAYAEETATAGLDHVYGGEHSFVGGGVAAFDCDGDGRPELYLAGGAAPSGLYRNDSEIGGALRFTHLPDPATDLTDVTGAYPLDLDGDGHTDLAVLRVGENVLLRGLGDCRFERANEALGFDGGQAWTTAFSATWEGDAPLPTLAFGNYLDPDDHERATCTDNVLIRPSGEDATYAAPVALAPGWCSLSLLFSDWDRSGRRDLRVSNDRHYHRDGQEQLWRVDTPGSDPEPYTLDDGWQPLRIWGMGIASHDLTGDGRPEVFLTSQGDNKLQTLADGGATPHFRDIAIERGVTSHRPHIGDDVRPSTSWHPEFQDVNNDGFVDLFVTKGNVDQMPDFAHEDPSSLLLGQEDGTFVEVADPAGIRSFGRGRGAAVVDLNLDGWLDVVEVNRGEDVRIWRNVGTAGDADAAAMGNHASVRLQQDGPNRDAIGAWLEVRTGDRTTWRELTVGGGHAGGQLGWIHLGFGAADRVNLRVHWPDGEVGPSLDVPAGSRGTVERGATALRRWELDP
ncbi:CRTAC1 family protein [Nitriliruptor alkaliphilus]|uniref:CRTAC1 family protein n=1 Tax=Nitriliruptor alkaliphilus TaxID=427918 RepID=UPI000A667295|nr:CRTAC1 family protein [Nitriliruptor alkaliphilus]